jgi:hypothetical protein
MDPQFDPDKLKALVHYICWRCEDPTKLGSVKLYKILWRSDFNAYLEFGNPVTGATYVKRQFGPVPSAALSAIQELEREHKLSTRVVEYYGREKKEFFALERPDFSLFSAEEISLVDKEIEYVTEEHTARSISEESHDDIWKMARIGEEIPYYTVFSKPAEITESDIEWAKLTIEELQN